MAAWARRLFAVAMIGPVEVPLEEFRKLTRPHPPLSRFFRESPLCGEELDLTRNTDLAREVEL